MTRLPSLPARLRKFIGLFVMLGWLFVYAIVALGLAARILPEAQWYGELAYYAVVGLAWILPLLPLIRWMNRPDQPLA